MLSFWVQNRHVYKCKVALCLLVFKLDFELQISFCVLAELTVAAFTYNNVGHVNLTSLQVTGCCCAHIHHFNKTFSNHKLI